LEAALFAADTPVTAEQLAAALDQPVYQVEEDLERLARRLGPDSGLQIVRIAGGYQLATKAEFASLVARITRPQTGRLTRAQLEVLAIVAYKQPITLPEIDGVRGVQSDYTIRQLVERRLIVDAGRKESPGRPVLYATTLNFLHLFSLDSLSELPDLALHQGQMLAIGPRTSDEQPALEIDA
jgi:segregation and condensation protein B